MNDRITVIASKDSGHYSSLGHIIDSWDSDLKILACDTSEQAFEFVSNLIVDDADEPGSYYFSYLVNGVPIDGDDFIDKLPGNYETPASYIKLITDIKSAVKDKVSVLLAEKERHAALKKAEDEAKKAAALREKELATLASLMDKYQVK